MKGLEILFFLYLLTNPNTTQIGIYPITKKQISFEIGYSTESVNALIDRYIKLDDESYHVSLYESSSKLEQEKEEQKEEQKEKEKHIIQRFAKLYEQNIGLVNGVASELLIDISKYVDIKLFKKAIDIATTNGKCNKGYVSGILKQWGSKNIKTYSDLKAYEVSIKNTGGNDYGTNNNNNAKNRYIEELESEDSELYRKPTKEQLEKERRLFEES